MIIKIDVNDAIRLTGKSVSDAQYILDNRDKDRMIGPSEVRDLIIAQFIIAMDSGNETEAKNALNRLFLV